MKLVEVAYFSDLLCVWAYIAEARIEKLRADFGAAVHVVPRTVSVFGDVPGKFRRGWSERGGWRATRVMSVRSSMASST